MNKISVSERGSNITLTMIKWKLKQIMSRREGEFDHKKSKATYDRYVDS